MANWEFYDYEEVEGEDQEPSFSFYDFKKWLDSNNIPFLKEDVENKTADQNKEALKEQFKKKITERVRDNVNKRLSERKKKRK